LQLEHQISEFKGELLDDKSSGVSCLSTTMLQRSDTFSLISTHPEKRQPISQVKPTRQRLRKMMHLRTIQTLLLLVLPAVAVDLARLAPGRRYRGLMVGSHDDVSKKAPHSSKSMKGSKSKEESPKGPKGSKSKKGKGSGSKSGGGASKSLKGSHSKSKIDVGSGQAGGKGKGVGSDHGPGAGGDAPASSSKNPVEPNDDESGGGGGGGTNSSGGGDHGGGTSNCQNIPITRYRSDIPKYYKEGVVVEGIRVGGLNSYVHLSCLCVHRRDRQRTDSRFGLHFPSLR
jgi:hypothetical protein